MASHDDAAHEEVTRAKRAAAGRAAALVGPGMAVGLGHGSTAVAAVPVLGQRARRGELVGTVFVAAAHFMAEALRREGLPVGSLDDTPRLDLAIDGADEIDPQGNCIKGGGGALLYEKIVAQAATRLVIVADAGKLSPRLGTRHALPVEITPFALRPELAFLAAIGGRPALRLRPDGDPMRTERGNVIADCAFGPLADPAGLAASLDARAGIAGHGLFVGLAGLLVVAGPDGIREIVPPGRG
ncbi:MAG: ribose-5-phosphate isomerase RpiA [Solidesulfovibrio sp. DCME]|uniref:ribose-5-phosphate isomerase RpiA n=1 Tax=Solidesulfovibrio sp. DCME TaxID=3447380 RepID=UPI003D10D4D4